MKLNRYIFTITTFGGAIYSTNAYARNDAEADALADALLKQRPEYLMIVSKLAEIISM